MCQRVEPLWPAKAGRGGHGGWGGWGDWGRDRGDRNRGRDGEGRGGEGRGGGTRGLGLMGTPDGLFSPDFLTRDVPMVVEELQLDDTQRIIVAQLFQDYDSNFRELLETIQAGTEELNENYEPDPDIQASMDAVRDSMREMRDEMREAREQMSGGEDRGRRNRGREGRGDDQAQQGGRDQGADQPMEDGQVPPPPTMTEEERRAQAEAMREEYRMRFTEMGEQMTDIRRRRTASVQMQELLDARVALIREFADGKRQLRISTASGVQALLLEEQAPRWDALERSLRRDRMLPRGRLSGESTDVLNVLEQEGLSEGPYSEELAMLLQNYELDLDEALRQREAYDYGTGLDLMEHLRNQDYDQALSSLRARLAIQETTRGVNDQYIDAISVVLPNGTGSPFRIAALRQGYSRIFRPTRGERAILAAMEIEDLDPELLGAIAELMQSHGDEIANANEDILIVLRSEEMALELRQSEERMERFREGRSGWGRDRDRDEFDPVRKSFENRNEIDERYLLTLKGMLSPDQYESVAGRRGRGQGGQWGEGGFSRENFISQFDKDGDGELNDEEREAVRESMRERFGGGRGGNGGGGQRGRGGPRPQEL